MVRIRRQYEEPIKHIHKVEATVLGPDTGTMYHKNIEVDKLNNSLTTLKTLIALEFVVNSGIKTHTRPWRVKNRMGD